MKLFFSELTGTIYGPTKRQVENFGDILILFLQYNKGIFKHKGYVVKLEKENKD